MISEASSSPPWKELKEKASSSPSGEPIKLVLIPFAIVLYQDALQQHGVQRLNPTKALNDFIHLLLDLV